MATEKCRFANFLRKRVIDCNAFGLWMHAHSNYPDHSSHIANILNIDIDFFKRGLRESSFTSDNSERILSYTKFGEALGFETILDIYSPRIGPNLKSVRLSMFKLLIQTQLQYQTIHPLKAQNLRFRSTTLCQEII